MSDLSNLANVFDGIRLSNEGENLFGEYAPLGNALYFGALNYLKNNNLTFNQYKQNKTDAQIKRLSSGEYTQKDYNTYANKILKLTNKNISNWKKNYNGSPSFETKNMSLADMQSSVSDMSIDTPSLTEPVQESPSLPSELSNGSFTSDTYNNYANGVLKQVDINIDNLKNYNGSPSSKTTSGITQNSNFQTSDLVTKVNNLSVTPDVNGNMPTSTNTNPKLELPSPNLDGGLKLNTPTIGLADILPPPDTSKSLLNKFKNLDWKNIASSGIGSLAGMGAGTAVNKLGHLAGTDKTKGGLFGTGLVSNFASSVVGSGVGAVSKSLMSGAGSNIARVFADGAKDALASNAGNYVNFGTSAANLTLDVFDPVKKAKFESGVNLGLGLAAALAGTGPVGWAIGGAALAFNGIGHLTGSKLDKFKADRDILASGGNSYGGTTNKVLSAEAESGSKFSGYNAGAFNRAYARQLDAKQQQWGLGLITSKANDANLAASNMVDFNTLLYDLDRQGGLNPYALSAKKGAKLEESYDYDKAREYVYDRFPILKNIEFELLRDNTFKPNEDLETDRFGNIEYWGSGYDTLGYYNNREKPDLFKGKSLIIFNDKATPEDIALDAVSHGLREQDPNWLELLSELTEDPTFRSIAEDEYTWEFDNWDELSNDEKQEYLAEFWNNPEKSGAYIDALVRAMLVKPEEREARGYGYSDEEFKAMSNSPVWLKMENYLKGEDISKYKQGGILSTIELTIPESTIELIAFDSFINLTSDDITEFKEGGIIELVDGSYIDLSDNIEDDEYVLPLSIIDYYNNPDLSKVKFTRGDKAYTEGDNLYVTNDESAVHELYHYLTKNHPDEAYKPWYEDLTDLKILSFGADPRFVFRLDDVNELYSPSELGARIHAAKYMLGNRPYNKKLFRELRKDENKHGDNMRDLLHMFDDDNLVKIFNEESLLKFDYSSQIEEFKNGGSVNVIPEGALHARKHNMETEGITKKGIPVIDNQNEQQAEIEREEIIFRLEVTEKLEKLYKKYYNSESSNKDKDEASLIAGKLLVEEILHNTIDNTNNLI